MVRPFTFYLLKFFFVRFVAFVVNSLLLFGCGQRLL